MNYARAGLIIAGVGLIVAALKLALDIILNWERIKAIWASFRAGSVGRFEAAKLLVYVVAERALRPILIIGAIVWLAIWIQGSLAIQFLRPLSSWTFRQYAFTIALIVPLALLVYILFVEPRRQPSRAEKALNSIMEKQEVPSSTFTTIDLPSYQPEKNYGCSCAPTGLIIVYQTPFFLHPVLKGEKLLGHRVIDIQPGMNNTATIEEVSANVESVSKVHFFLSAGNAWISHGVQGRRIGHLELGFTDGSKQRVDLMLGEHIREWSFGDRTEEKVNDIDESITRPAWVSHDNTCRIDTMSVSVDEGPKDLIMVQIVAELEEPLEKAVPPPSIIISAITCETSPSLLQRSR